jgi:hypothetical protein
MLGGEESDEGKFVLEDFSRLASLLIKDLLSLKISASIVMKIGIHIEVSMNEDFANRQNCILQ